MIPFYWWAAQRTLLSEGIWKPKDLAFPVVMFCIISPLASLSNIVNPTSWIHTHTHTHTHSLATFFLSMKKAFGRNNLFFRIWDWRWGPTNNKSLSKGALVPLASRSMASFNSVTERTGCAGALILHGHISAVPLTAALIVCERQMSWVKWIMHTIAWRQLLEVNADVVVRCLKAHEPHQQWGPIFCPRVSQDIIIE